MSPENTTLDNPTTQENSVTQEAPAPQETTLPQGGNLTPEELDQLPPPTGEVFMGLVPPLGEEAPETVEAPETPESPEAAPVASASPEASDASQAAPAVSEAVIDADVSTAQLITPPTPLDPAPEAPVAGTSQPVPSRAPITLTDEQVAALSPQSTEDIARRSGADVESALEARQAAIDRIAAERTATVGAPAIDNEAAAAQRVIADAAPVVAPEAPVVPEAPAAPVASAEPAAPAAPEAVAAPEAPTQPPQQ